METMVYMGLRAIFDDIFKVIVSATASGTYSRMWGKTYHQLCQTMFIMASIHYRSGRVLICGWTMLCKWGHPVATLPVAKVTIRHIHVVTEILRNITPSLGTNPLCRVSIPTTSRTDSPKGTRLSGFDLTHIITAPGVRGFNRQGVEHVVRYAPGC
eukprot:6205454-Pleurochrysis_carterae.AAC.2